MVDLFREDPDAMFRGNERPALGKDAEQRKARFIEALNKCRILPQADPNVPSEMHRKLLAMGLKQLTAPGGVPNPQYDQIKVDRYIAKTVFKMTDSDFNGFLAPQAPPPPPPIDPIAQAKLQIDAQNADNSA
jgi:hypothetical protein